MQECRCSTTQILAYQKKISGPLLDRIDLIVHVGRIPHQELLKNPKTNLAKKAREDIQRARNVQKNRYKTAKKTNATISSQQIKKQLSLADDVVSLLNEATKRLHLSTRSYFKVIKVARTIADLENEVNINTKHISEALQYRMDETKL